MSEQDAGPFARPLSSDLEGLRLEECWDALRSASLGRLAVLGPDGAPDIFPMNYTVSEERIFVRSAPGAKLVDLARDPRVAFEVDSVGDIVWSVVVRGTAARLDADDEIEASGVLDLRSASPTGKQDFIRISPREITGRRFRSALRR
ncbi:MAG: pyridoxamine 5'-phosphate oxidase family protein [Microbacterium sp.]|uniref:pyridoxamine 5'-phosphate oxidase family protein n=1 Tax=Microbacterium sp. TaxID=51671 RepID=UPI0039E5DD6C